MTDTLQPLRLAVGSHHAGSGKGCAMNVISWESGDSTITDFPVCADPMLARVVQRVNDGHCTHRDGDMLCPPCSVEVLALAHRTTGTNLTALGWSGEDVRRVHVRLALDEAESVARPGEDPRVAKCREVVAGWLNGQASVDDVREARAAAAAAYATAAAADAAYAAWGTSRLARAHALVDRFEALTGVRAAETTVEQTASAVAKMAVMA